MKVLLFGAGGQLGKELSTSDLAQDIEISAMHRKDADITKLSDIRAAASSNLYNCIINAAAYTAVDLAESEFLRADLINRLGARNVAQVAYELGIPLIHISTDFVFDGKNIAPYTEGDKVNPINVYGRTKEAGECEVRKLMQKHVIIRTSWLYGIHGSNFVKSILQLGISNKKLQIVNDQFGSPTATSHLVRVILEIAKKIQENNRKINWGTYHYCGHGKTNWCQFAKVIIESAQFKLINKPNVEGITSSQYRQAAPRPADTHLNCAKIVDAFGVKQVPWEIGVKETVDALSREHFQEGQK